ncbi:hypothetical protein DPMN_021313 [Dreissena polymorpha]|uniref:Uncharacterized protein n=1 Tax=Dreissena polymorpha TaxID=45954 RepID=A0A9D4NLY4_DREPO|nr:hypothetical protein DPMN_021313 [Dreissena polymorpha]
MWDLRSTFMSPLLRHSDLNNTCKLDNITLVGSSEIVFPDTVGQEHISISNTDIDLFSSRTIAGSMFGQDNGTVNEQNENLFPDKDVFQDSVGTLDQELQEINNTVSRTDQSNTGIPNASTDSSRPSGISNTSTDSSRPSSIPNASTDSGRPSGIPDACTDSSRPSGIPNASADSSRPSGIPNASTDSSYPSGIPNASIDSSRPSGIPNASNDSSRPSGIHNASTDSGRPSGIPNASTDSSRLLGIPNASTDSRRPSGIPNASTDSSCPSGIPNASTDSSRLFHDKLTQLSSTIEQVPIVLFQLLRSNRSISLLHLMP